MQSRRYTSRMNYGTSDVRSSSTMSIINHSRIVGYRAHLRKKPSGLSDLSRCECYSKTAGCWCCIFGHSYTARKAVNLQNCWVPHYDVEELFVFWNIKNHRIRLMNEFSAFCALKKLTGEFVNNFYELCYVTRSAAEHLQCSFGGSRTQVMYGRTTSYRNKDELPLSVS